MNAVYLISGGFDLLVTLEGRNLKEISSFVSEKLSALDGVLSTATHFILKNTKTTEPFLQRKRRYKGEKLRHEKSAVR